MLIISKLNKTFRIDKHDNFHVLNNINYKFEDSGVYVIYGRSGEGKTTFLNSLYGIIILQKLKMKFINTYKNSM